MGESAGTHVSLIFCAPAVLWQSPKRWNYLFGLSVARMYFAGDCIDKDIRLGGISAKNEVGIP